MSEFHPNRTKQVRTRPKLTARRILEAWPLLVWLAVAALAYFVYRGGVIFVRMNGAVDPYQENITPINEGRLMEVKVKRGDKVPPNTVLAVMDSSKYRLDLESLKRDIISDRLKDIRDFDSDLIKLESELRKIQTEDGEDSAVIRELSTLVAEIDKLRPGEKPEFRDMRLRMSDNVRIRVELAKANGRNAHNAAQQGTVKESIKRTTDARDLLGEEAKTIGSLDLGGSGSAAAGNPNDRKPLTVEELKAKVDQIVKSLALRDDEHQRFVELQTKIEQCQLITTHGGTVDRIGKEVGEFIIPGDGILKIVGDPEQVVCFLPQDQANDLEIGRKVWISNTSDKSQIFDSIVIGVSPRINSLADATSPLPNRRVHGREIIVQYPEDAKPSAPGEPFKLLPGQTVIIHLEKPGEVPWINRLFHTDEDQIR